MSAARSLNRRRPAVVSVALLALGCAGAPPAELYGLSPDPVLAGGSVTVEGSGLGTGADASRILLVSHGGERPVGVSDAAAWEPSRVTFVVPRALPPAPYTVHLEIDGVRSNGLPLSVSPPPRPALRSLVPPRAEPGRLMTLLGSGFGPDEGRVRFAPDVAATTSGWSDAEIIVTMPDAPATDAVRVETAEGIASDWFALPPPEPEPRLAVIQDTVFTPRCAYEGCHGALPSEGLSLVEGDSFASLVGVPSTQLPGVMRVDPYSPETSLLYDKLIHDPPAVGRRMPAGLPPLEGESTALIEAWIRAGAPSD